MQDFEESFENNRYIKASDGIIDIGISIDEDQFTRKTELDLSKIIIIESNTNTICDIRSYSIDDVEFDSSIVFETLGKKILKVCVEYNETEIIVEIPVKVWNAFFPDSIINISNTVLHNLTPVKNDDGSYSIDIRIENFTSISIIETEQSTSQLSSRTINDNPSFLDNMKLIIVLNDVLYDATIEFDNSLVFTFENVVVESSMLNCDIFYYYQGINGKWCEATVEIAKELK